MGKFLFVCCLGEVQWEIKGCNSCKPEQAPPEGCLSHTYVILAAVPRKYEASHQECPPLQDSEWHLMEAPPRL